MPRTDREQHAEEMKVLDSLSCVRERGGLPRSRRPGWSQHSAVHTKDNAAGGVRGMPLTFKLSTRSIEIMK